MKVIIRNKLFSLRGNSSVRDEEDEDVFYIKGKIISPTRVKWICDIDGNKLYKVRNKYWNFFSRIAYIYDKDNVKIANVKHPFFGMKKFIIQGYKDEILIDGDFFSLKSTIMKNGVPVGEINRKLTLVADAFSLEADESEMPFMIALVIAIDNITDRNND